MTLILDTGAFLAIERGDRNVMALLKRELLGKRSPLTHAGVVAQAWRGGTGRQVALARFLPAVEISPIDEQLARRTGVLLGRVRKSDVVDAALALLAVDGDWLLTSDTGDLRPLVDAAGLHIDVIRV